MAWQTSAWTPWMPRIAAPAGVPAWPRRSSPRQGRTSISMLVSLNGTNFFPTGTTLLPFRPGPGGTPTFKLGQGTQTKEVSRYTAFRSILNAEYANLMEDAFADLSESVHHRGGHHQRRHPGNQQLPHDPLASSLGEQLRTIAKLVQASGPLGMKRQVFFAPPAASTRTARSSLAMRTCSAASAAP